MSVAAATRGNSMETVEMNQWLNSNGNESSGRRTNYSYNSSFNKERGPYSNISEYRRGGRYSFGAYHGDKSKMNKMSRMRWGLGYEGKKNTKMTRTQCRNMRRKVRAREKKAMLRGESVENEEFRRIRFVRPTKGTVLHNGVLCEDSGKSGGFNHNSGVACEKGEEAGGDPAIVPEEYKECSEYPGWSKEEIFHVLHLIARGEDPWKKMVDVQHHDMKTTTKLWEAIKSDLLSTITFRKAIDHVKCYLMHNMPQSSDHLLNRESLTSFVAKKINLTEVPSDKVFSIFNILPYFKQAEFVVSFHQKMDRNLLSQFDTWKQNPSLFEGKKLEIDI